CGMAPAADSPYAPAPKSPTTATVDTKVFIDDRMLLKEGSETKSVLSKCFEECVDNDREEYCSERYFIKQFHDEYCSKKKKPSEIRTNSVGQNIGVVLTRLGCYFYTSKIPCVYLMCCGLMTTDHDCWPSRARTVEG